MPASSPWLRYTESARLRPGKLAETWSFSREDVSSIDLAQAHKVEALLTIFDGRAVVYRSEDSFE